jgi:hypothetical protein
MNLIQELLNILDRKEDKKSLDLKRDWFEFGRTKPSNVGNPLYSPRMAPHAIRFDNLVASIEENLSATSEIGKAIYNIKYSNDNSVVPANGQVIYNQASREIYVSKIDALGNDREIAFDTILLTEGNPGVKPVGLFWAKQLNPWTSYSSQYFNTCGSEFLKFICVEPTPGDTFIFNPGNGPVGNNGGEGIPIDLVYAQTEQGLMTGGSGASLVTVYIEPLIASQTIQVARRNAAGIQFVFEQIASPAALMTAYYNQDYVTVDPSIAGNNWWGMYTDSAMTSPVGDGFYMLHTEWLAMSGGDHGHITSISGGNYLQTSKTFLNTTLNDPSGDPDLVCTAVTRSLNITKHVSGDYYIIPWIETQQQGLYKPSNFEKAFFVLDMAGSNVCGFGANGSGAAETITDVAYDSNQNILAHLDESGVIALMPLNGNDYTLEMNGTDLELLKEGTVVNTIDLSPFLDDTNLARIINGALSGTDLVLTRDDGTTITIDLSSIGNTTPVMTSTVTGTGKLWDDTVQVEDAVPVSAEPLRTYGVQFNDASQLVVNVPWESGSVVVANPGNPIADLTSISVDGISYGIASTGADGNDFIDSVTLTGSDLIFTGSGGAFSGTIDLSGLSGTTYTASNGIELVNPTEFGLIDVAKTNSSSIANPNHTDSFTVIDDITTNTKGQVTAVNVKTVTLPASGTGADGVITDVALTGNDLKFVGSNGGFNGVVDLSGYANAPETVTSLSINANILTYTDENNADTDIDLSLYLDDTNLARLVSGTLDAGTGVATFTRDDATTFTLDLSSLLDTDTNTEYGITLSTYLSGATLNLLGTDGSQDFVRILPGSGISMSLANDELTISSTIVDTNDIDYVIEVALNGDSLDFTGVGNAFTGSIDLSGYANSGATYTAGTGLTLNGSTFDANVNAVVQVEASSPVTAIRDRVYDVQVNGSDKLVVNVPWIDTRYSAGTYLTLSGSQFNHNNTTRTNTTSTASPAAGASFTVVDSVVTNTTGHITGVNTKTITLPEGGGSPTCVTGMWYSRDQTGNQLLTNTFREIGNPVLGFKNTDSVTKHYAISWTIQYGVSGTAGIRFFETQMAVEVSGGGTLISPESRWADSGYMGAEYSTTRTYTLYTNMGPNDIIYPQVKGSPDVFIKKAHIQVVETTCESTNNRSIEVIQGMN